MSPGSIMPNYAWMLDDDLDTSTTAAKIRAMQTLGVPYPAGYDQIANADLMHQADSITKNLADAGIKTVSNKEIIAMIAYLQRLGTDIKRDVASTK
jgi:cytochrome c oxidase cbb3-type subunit I/II